MAAEPGNGNGGASSTLQAELATRPARAVPRRLADVRIPGPDGPGRIPHVFGRSEGDFGRSKEVFGRVKEALGSAKDAFGRSEEVII